MRGVHARTTRPPVGSSPGAVRVPQGAIRSDAISNELLELLQLGKPTLARARPDHLTVERHLEDALISRTQRDFGELPLEGDEQLLRHPRRAQEPAAAGTVGDLDARHASSVLRLDV